MSEKPGSFIARHKTAELVGLGGLAAAAALGARARHEMNEWGAQVGRTISRYGLENLAVLLQSEDPAETELTGYIRQAAAACLVAEGPRTLDELRQLTGRPSRYLAPLSKFNQSLFNQLADAGILTETHLGAKPHYQPSQTLTNLVETGQEQLPLLVAQMEAYANPQTNAR